VDGAAGGNLGQRDPTPNTPAARAALASPRPTRSPPEPDGQARRGRRPLRAALVTALILVVIGGGLFGLYRWTQTQYFVGVAADRVVVYRGINTALGPLKLYSVVQTSGVWVDDLQPVARSQVESGIAAPNRTEAEKIVSNLDTRMLPLCPQRTTTTTPPPSTTPAKAPVTSHPPAGRSPGSHPPPKTTPPPRTTASPSPTPSPTPTDQPVPGVDCRNPR
jgi:hypothetical protein